MEALDNLVPDEQEHPFGDHEEEAIVSLIIDHPELFTSLARFLKHQLFKKTEVQYVIAQILTFHETYNVFPTRGMLLDIIKKDLTVEAAGYEDILKIADRQSDPREIPYLKGRILDWARKKSYGLIYDPEVMARFADGDFEYLEQVFNQARNIQDVGAGTLWFFDEAEKLFVRDVKEKFTTGFKQLDAYMHNDDDIRGPCRKEELVWMAPTGVGKCHTLQSKIIERNLSQIFELELDNGTIIKLAGFREVQTARGRIKVCDLTDGDDIIEIPDIVDEADLHLPDM